MLSVAMLRFSIELSLSLLTEVCMCCIKLLSKVCVKQHLEVLVQRLTFTKFACIILMHYSREVECHFDQV